MEANLTEIPIVKTETGLKVVCPKFKGRMSLEYCMQTCSYHRRRITFAHVTCAYGTEEATHDLSASRQPADKEPD